MTIEQKQCLLKYLGYYQGKVDGIWGQQSTHATAGFQDDYGLEATGVFDAETEARIKEAVAGLVEPLPPAEPTDLWAEIKYFKREEFRCKCGGAYCDGFPVEPDPRLVRMAEKVREHFGVPMDVSSGIRCETHNRNVGGVAHSRHMAGRAMDFRLRGKSSSEGLAYIQTLPECRYVYAIDGNYLHMDVGK